MLLVRFPGVRGATEAGAAAPQGVQGAAQAGKINKATPWHPLPGNPMAKGFEIAKGRKCLHLDWKAKEPPCNSKLNLAQSPG